MLSCLEVLFPMNLITVACHYMITVLLLQCFPVWKFYFNESHYCCMSLHDHSTPTTMLSCLEVLFPMNLIIVTCHCIISYVLVHNLKLCAPTQHTLCHYIISLCTTTFIYNESHYCCTISCVLVHNLKLCAHSPHSPHSTHSMHCALQIGMLVLAFPSFLFEV